MSQINNVRDLARGQDGIVAGWQCKGLAMSRASFRAAVAGWREPHDSVFLSGHGRVSAHQRLLITSLTTPESAVSHESAGAFYGLRKRDHGSVSLIRPGSGGPFAIPSRLPRRPRTRTSISGYGGPRPGRRATSSSRTASG